MKRLYIFRFIPKVFVITVGVGLLVAISLIFGQWRGFRNRFATQREAAPTPTQTTLIPQKDMNQEILIPLQGIKEAIKYEIVSAELLEEISVRGQRVKAADNRVFLVLNIKITNSNPKAIQINSRDFVRISWGDEWVAPDVHNDPLEVQAISTKRTRVGFAVDRAAKNFRIKIGEIKGEKIDFELAF